jgi:hypothetical protein
MRKLFSPLLLVATVLLFNSCVYEEFKKEETKLLEEAVSDFYYNISAFNCDKIADQCTEDFAIVEEYKLWNTDSVCVDLMKDRGAKLKYVLKDFKVHITQNTAIVIYKLKETITKDSLPVENDFLESAVLDRKPGSDIWKISFIHSTVVK